LPHLHYSRWKYRDIAGEFGRSSSGPLPDPPPLDDDTRASILKALIIGTPDQVAKRIKEFGKVWGTDMHFVARSNYPGIPEEMSRNCIRLLGEVKKQIA
jgi:alkanesulfonate monooxygenase SsuD/methylene tetrahydromethanopterin reductase-like flavin-dependent oxidoreductase (luciferase family)